VKLQNIQLIEAEQQHKIKISAQEIKQAQSESKYLATIDYSDQLEKQYKKEKRMGRLAKLSVPIAFIAGLLIGNSK